MSTGKLNSKVFWILAFVSPSSALADVVLGATDAEGLQSGTTSISLFVEKPQADDTAVAGTSITLILGAGATFDGLMTTGVGINQPPNGFTACHLVHSQLLRCTTLTTPGTVFPSGRYVLANVRLRLSSQPQIVPITLDSAASECFDTVGFSVACTFRHGSLTIIGFNNGFE
jgi:hypothetical protein